MKTKRARRILTLVLCTLFILVSLCLTFFVVTQTGHGCIGECCQVCLRVEQAKAVLRGMVHVGLGLFLALPAWSALSEGFTAVRCRGLRPSPVMLKIRLDN